MNETKIAKCPSLAERDEAVAHLDTAVRLLKPFSLSRDYGSKVPCNMTAVYDFLTLPAIKAILKAQEADDA